MRLVVGGALLGMAQREGYLHRVPTIAQLGTEGSLAAIAYAWRRWMGGPAILDDVIEVSAVVASNQFGREGLSGGSSSHGAASGDEFDVHGDD